MLQQNATTTLNNTEARGSYNSENETSHNYDGIFDQMLLGFNNITIQKTFEVIKDEKR
jgi:hypothetical protein